MDAISSCPFQGLLPDYTLPIVVAAAVKTQPTRPLFVCRAAPVIETPVKFSPSPRIFSACRLLRHRLLRWKRAPTRTTATAPNCASLSVSSKSLYRSVICTAPACSLSRGCADLRLSCAIQVHWCCRPCLCTLLPTLPASRTDSQPRVLELYRCPQCLHRHRNLRRPRRPHAGGPTFLVHKGFEVREGKTLQAI